MRRQPVQPISKARIAANGTRNPWRDLPQAEPFVLSRDEVAIKAFNNRVDLSKRLHMEVPPHPFLGNPLGRVVLLSLNPGFHEQDYPSYTQNPLYPKAHRKMLLHGKQQFPFVHLDPTFGASPGATYYRTKLRWLIDTFGVETVANEVFWVQFFPYPSREYRSFGQVLHSQLYGFHLVRQAMERDAAIVLMRARDDWTSVIPQLAKYPVHVLASPRAGSISPRNAPSAVKAISKLFG